MVTDSDRDAARAWLDPETCERESLSEMVESLATLLADRAARERVATKAWASSLCGEILPEGYALSMQHHIRSLPADPEWVAVRRGDAEILMEAAESAASMMGHSRGDDCSGCKRARKYRSAIDRLRAAVAQGG